RLRVTGKTLGPLLRALRLLLYERYTGSLRPAKMLLNVRALLGVVAVSVLVGGSAAAAVSRSSVPARFQPLSFTAVSERDFWLLGTVPCRRGRCTAIVRTRNGGKSFAAVHAPALPMTGTTPELRFADRLDGFVFVRWR